MQSFSLHFGTQNFIFLNKSRIVLDIMIWTCLLKLHIIEDVYAGAQRFMLIQFCSIENNVYKNEYK